MYKSTQMQTYSFEFITVLVRIWPHPLLTTESNKFMNISKIFISLVTKNYNTFQCIILVKFGLSWTWKHLQINYLGSDCNSGVLQC